MNYFLKTIRINNNTSKLIFVVSGSLERELLPRSFPTRKRRRRRLRVGWSDREKLGEFCASLNNEPIAILSNCRRCRACKTKRERTLTPRRSFLSYSFYRIKVWYKSSIVSSFFSPVLLSLHKEGKKERKKERNKQKKLFNKLAFTTSVILKLRST